MRPAEAIRKALQEHRVVAITGGPNTGKTTFANRAHRANPNLLLIGGDSYMHHGWSESSQMLMQAVNAESIGKVLVEGVQVPRAIRKGMRVDCLIVLIKVYGKNTKRQAAMAKGVHTVMAELLRDKQLAKTMEIITLLD